MASRVMCDLCGHHMDKHFRNEENCLTGGCKCVAYTKLEDFPNE